VARGITRPLVPLEERPAVFHAIHNVAHPGICATKRMLTAHFVWKGVGKDVAAMCRECQQCQRGKVHKQPAAPVQAIPVPAHKFSHVHVDLVGPLPASSEGHVYLLTIIDRSTRWFEAVPLRNMEASTCMDAFTYSWVARFGVPETVTTDRGTQFTSALLSSTCTSLASSTCSQQPTIHRVTAWLSACTGSSRMPYVHVERVLRGILIFRGCYWAYVPRLRMILQCLQQSWLLGHHWFFLDSSCTCQILHVWTCHRLPRGRCPMPRRPTHCRLT
jgi:hypothetical protein